jgi:hypothetical protein|tara:strand:- start:2925 stop:4919 length:1995 start_codon:yes stop_codon:yes gene_type:complete
MFSLSGLSPAEGSTSIELNSLIEFTIIDDGVGIDSSTLIVYVNGFEAISGLAFKSPYNGSYSDINPVDKNLSIVIDPESDFSTGSLVYVKVQVKDLNGKYFNTDYLFKVIRSEPELTVSSPSKNDIVKAHQVVFLQFEDKVDGVDMGSVNIKINDLQAIKDGSPQSGFSESGISDVRKVTNGISVKIDPDENFRDGSYRIDYSVRDTKGNRAIGAYNFTIKIPFIPLPAILPQSSFVGFAQGIKKVSDLGVGNILRVDWHTPRARSYKGDIFALIYENSSRLKIFDSDPKYVATNEISTADINGYTPGNTLSFAVRAMETYKDTFSVSGMKKTSSGVYEIPPSVSLTELIDAEDTMLRVSSVSGFPDKGFLVLNDSEVVKYISKSESENIFYLAQKGRGLSGTKASVHISGDPVKMFTNCQDSNTVIIMATPTYQDGYVSGREVDNIGLVVTDYTDNDKKFFQGFDYCGYHRSIPDRVLTGTDDCGSYLGGEFDGMRGMNLFDRMLNREEILLDQTGEPVILLRRIWNGQTCECVTTRRPHPKVKSCSKCYGTGFIGGYNQYINKRRVDRRLMVTFGDTAEDLKLGAHQHLEQSYEPQCWTIPTPAIRDRDIVIRFDFTDDIEYMYEVLDCTKDKLFYRHYTRQRLKLKRMDKTDILYTFKYTF